MEFAVHAEYERAAERKSEASSLVVFVVFVEHAVYVFSFFFRYADARIFDEDGDFLFFVVVCPSDNDFARRSELECVVDDLSEYLLESLRIGSYVDVGTSWTVAERYVFGDMLRCGHRYFVHCWSEVDVVV